jgi:hypothetical protein
MLDYVSGVKRSGTEAERNRSEAEPKRSEAEPNGTEWNRMEPKMKSTIPTSNGQCLIQFME